VISQNRRREKYCGDCGDIRNQLRHAFGAVLIICLDPLDSKVGETSHQGNQCSQGKAVGELRDSEQSSCQGCADNKSQCKQTSARDL
jgi:hypothetical protein